MVENFIKTFKAIAEPTRVKIIKLIHHQPMCVCELGAVLEMLQPRISQHMRILKEANLVVERKEGYFTYYSLNKDELDRGIIQFQDFLQRSMNELPEFAEMTDKIGHLAEDERVKMVKECKDKGAD